MATKLILFSESNVPIHQLGNIQYVRASCSLSKRVNIRFSDSVRLLISAEARIDTTYSGNSIHSKISKRDGVS